MACRIIVDQDDGQAVFICSVSSVAFGPIMRSAKWAEAFAKRLGRDPREIPVNDLIDKWSEFRHEAHRCRHADNSCTVGCDEITMNATLCDDCETAALKDVEAT